MIRVAVAGAGAWGINHVRVFAAERSCQLTYVCDPRSDALERARALTTARLTERFEDLLDADVDAIVIATPAALHADLACRALAAGKHVLVEKPLALSTPDAERVVAAARTSGRAALVGHLMVYHPAVVHLRALVTSGELGALRYVHASRVNLGRIRSDENALWSFGPHDLSILELVLGERPSAVAAQGAAFLQPEIEDVVFITLRYPSGALGHIHLSWLDPRKERRLTVVGSHKMAELDDLAQEKLRIFDRGYDRPPSFSEYGEYLTIRHGDVHAPQIAMEEPLRIMARHFIDCCNGAPPRTDVASGLGVVEVLEAAQKSMRSRGSMVQVRFLDPRR